MNISIRCTKGHTATVDEIDGDLAPFAWQTKPTGRGFYLMRGTPDYAILDRLLLARILERPLARTEYVFHADGDAFNCMRGNLQLMTRGELMAALSVHKNNQAGYKGVYRANNRYRAVICINQRRIWLGRFDTAEDAHEAYVKATARYYGEFAPSAAP